MTPDDIVKMVCNRHGLEVEKVLGRCKYREYAECRWEIYYRLRTEKLWSYARIARYMKRHHTGVIHGVRKHKQMIAEVVGERSPRYYSDMIDTFGSE